MKTVYQDENNVVLDENSVERKPCINRESKNLELTIYLYSCHDININFLVVVTTSSIYQKNGNTLWKDAIKLDKKDSCVSFNLCKKGEKDSVGYT